jgi:hypothetical protein
MDPDSGGRRGRRLYKDEEMNGRPVLGDDGRSSLNVYRDAREKRVKVKLGQVDGRWWTGLHI